MKIFSNFFKFFQTNDYLNYLEKLVKQHFPKTLFDASESAKITFFCDITKVENFDKKCLTLSKENQKSPFKHIRFGKSKSPVKGLLEIEILGNNLQKAAKRRNNCNAVIFQKLACKLDTFQQ
jgi:hypothetical protein